MAKESLRIQLQLPPHRVVFENVWNGRKSDNKNDDGEFDKDYGYMAIFDKPETMTPANKALYDQMIDAALKCRTAYFGPQTTSKYVGPLFDGTEYNKDSGGKYPFLEGKICMNLKSKNRPIGVANGVNPDTGVYDGNPRNFTDKSKWYAGCYAIADGAFYCYDNKSVGMRFGINNTMKIADGEPLVGTNNPQLAFQGVKVDASQFVAASVAANAASAGNAALMNSDRKDDGLGI